MPLVELYGHQAHAMKPRGLDQPIEEIVLTTLDIDLDEINGIYAQLVEHRRYVADLHLG
jgi:hypothetical protein